MCKIIVLNGCGSSGKTSIARAIAHHSEELWLIFGIDTLIDMIGAKQESYFNCIPGHNARGPTVRIDVQREGEKLFSILPKWAEMFANHGHNLIIDEVLWTASALQAYKDALKNHEVYCVGIFCDLQTMQERELLRQDRAQGLSNDQIDLVHSGMLDAYDLKIDTTKFSPFSAAKEILRCIHQR